MPSTQYVLEFPVDRLLIIVSVYAPNTTDLSLVAATLRNLAGVVEQRAQPVNTIIAAAPTKTPEPTFTPTPVGLSPLADPSDPTRLHPNWRHLANKPGEDSYALRANNSVAVISAPKSISFICHRYRGNFEVTARYTLGEHRNFLGAGIGVQDTQSAAWFFIMFWDSDNWVNEDWWILTGGRSNTNQSIARLSWDMDRRRAYSNQWFLRIVRSANSVFSAYSSSDGVRWRTEREDVVVTMLSEEVDICLYSESGRDAEGFVATFDRIELKPR
ncbi:MAG: hypothetical protein CUN51_00065 [Candidatus Thermofonsia Clade 1 bacterium]|uniref:DUF1349 domain-containing protein n=1 Tax=Candidatus Thermofonsia Clade 1 bacterium TaxID=2364210 RepID=A0A2M8P3E2_9CHLR|nr:MAG: hypothetical protein CUN51_00065 [Candidatus Thermofonsia Clade 1 bacterium]